MFHFVPKAFHYPESPALDPSQTPSPGQKHPCSAVCGSSLSPALSPWEDCVLRAGAGCQHANPHAGSHLHKRALVCSFPACPQNIAQAAKS